MVSTTAYNILQASQHSRLASYVVTYKNLILTLTPPPSSTSGGGKSRQSSQDSRFRTKSKSPNREGGKPYPPRGRQTAKTKDKRKGTTPDQSKERSKERSRGNSNNSAYSNQSRASSRASSTSSLDGQLKAVQYHTRESRSRNKHQKVKMPSLFRNQSPSSRKVWEDSYFMDTKNPDKFKDVMSSKKCLRCYSSTHLANACRRFRTPCPTPCFYCRYLFHPPSECHMHDSAGSVRSKN